MFVGSHVNTVTIVDEHTLLAIPNTNFCLPTGQENTSESLK